MKSETSHGPPACHVVAYATARSIPNFHELKRVTKEKGREKKKRKERSNKKKRKEQKKKKRKKGKEQEGRKQAWICQMGTQVQKPNNSNSTCFCNVQNPLA
jgi:hypothetical protein